ncbi:MAG: universal stress protein [Rubrivivax sp.]
MNAPLKFLLPVDGSPHALAAVRHALRLAPPGSSFVLVNVQEPASLYEVVVAHDAERIAEVKREAGADLLQAAEALLDAAGAAYESEVAAGVPEHLIVDLAENYGCDAIVLGARGRGAPADAGGLGRITRAVLDASPVPVTVVRPPSAEPQAAAA